MKIIIGFMVVVLVLVSLGLYKASALRSQNRILQARPDKTSEREAARNIHRGLGGNRKTIPQELLETRGDLFKRLEIGLVVLTPNQTEPWGESYLLERACAADAIFIGTVRDKSSQLTEDKTFIFTDYGFVIDTILRNDSPFALTPETAVVLSRIGGEVQINGRKVQAVADAAQPFEIGGRYLVFVTYLPERNTFAANNLAFGLKGKNVGGLSEQPQSKSLLRNKDADSLINSVKTISAQCSEDGGAR